MAAASGFQVDANAAELYERYAVPYMMAPWAPQLVDIASLRPGEHVLDLACGTGLVARLAASRVGSTGRVTAMDLNAGMLAVGRALPAAPGATIAWVEGSALAMSLANASVDVILCQQGLQFFPDKLASLREMHRVLVPGGRLALSVWKSAGPYNIAIADGLARHVGSDTATKYLASRRVPGAEDLHGWLVEAGFRDIDVRSSAMTIRLPSIETFVLQHLSASPVAGAVSTLTDAGRTALARQIRTALHPFADGDGVAVPDETHLATAHS
jgi:ubiquinone/menaquinone biosynthesis C-methylase UbiE